MALTGPIPELVEQNLKHVVICAGTHLMATAVVIKVNIPFAHKLIKLRSHLNVVLSTADTIATLKNTSGTAFTGGVLTITAPAALPTATRPQTSPPAPRSKPRTPTSRSP